MNEKIKILVVDDEQIVRESLSAWLSDVGYEVLIASNGKEALKIIEKEKLGIVVADLVMPEMDGIELLNLAKSVVPTISFIIITAHATIQTAIMAMKEGAFDYVEKPFCPEKIEMLVEKLAQHQNLIKENLSLKEKLKDKYCFKNMIAKSYKMLKIFDLIKTVANSNATVLITGESGTGKELVARAIHSISYRKSAPFVSINCSAIPETLLETELFGHEKGSFTDAIARKKGKFEYADKGILFLDEISEMSLNTQAHFLRVLEQKEFTRVGGNESIKVDVRILAATNTNLRSAIQHGKFREDLFYRLNVINIELPPLKERKEDIIPLSEYFLEKYSVENKKQINRISQEALELLMKYEWPGNVRELENAIERAVVLCESDIIMAKDISLNASPGKCEAESGGKKKLKEIEKDYILEILKSCGGNRTRAAEMLGIERMTLYNKLKSYGIEDQPE